MQPPRVGGGPGPSSAPRAARPASAAGHNVSAQVVLFVCANGARPGAAAASALRSRPPALPVEWPFTAEEIVVPCTGKLQPEHLLKAFEAGADIVGILACEDANCHYVEGSRRAHRRFDYVRGMLDELGLGGERLQLFHLPGSAAEDMSAGLGAARPDDAARKEELERRLREIAAEIAGKLRTLGASPLRRAGPTPEEALEHP